MKPSLHMWIIVAATVANPGWSQTQQSTNSAGSPSSAQGAEAARKSPTAAPIYGSQLMTEEERTAYRNKMHAAKTAREREEMRAEHHKEMQARAKERGLTLPDEPRGPGKGRGPGGGNRANPDR